jgi:hypothetical protein
MSVISLRDARDVRTKEWQIASLRFEIERRAFGNAPDARLYIDSMLAELERIKRELVGLRAHIGGLQ